MVERDNGIVEVRGSTPLLSTVRRVVTRRVDGLAVKTAGPSCFTAPRARDAGARTDVAPPPGAATVARALDLFLLALAGALGALARYSVYRWIGEFAAGEFPWATIAVNLLGSFLFGAVVTLADEGRVLSPRARVVVLSGFLGAFTTFSTFAFETRTLLGTGHWIRAIANAGAQNCGAVLGVILGMAAARAAISP